MADNKKLADDLAASLQEALDYVRGKPVQVKVSTFENGKLLSAHYPNGEPTPATPSNKPRSAL